ncbi:hypothetical protein [Streptomyces goshikiensis]|uniref:hypothetical protein n=1 Tax=Streptomyces goshikiensis TaxID=1942 RepID=UPI0036465D3E
MLMRPRDLPFIRRLRSRPSDRRLRKSCAAQLADLPIPTPFTIPALVQAMEKTRGRRIMLVPLPQRVSSPGTACGLWVKLPGADLVFFEKGTTAFHQTRIILHELAHIWLGHAGAMTPEQLQRFTPDLDVRLVARFMRGAVVAGRTNYETQQERAAEISAQLISEFAKAVAEERSGDVVGRLNSTLAHPMRRKNGKH